MTKISWLPKELFEYHSAYWKYVSWFQKFLYNTMKAFGKEPRVVKVCEKGLQIHYNWVMNPDKHKFDEVLQVGLRIFSKLNKLCFEFKNQKLEDKYQEGIRQYLVFKKKMDV